MFFFWGGGVGNHWEPTEPTQPESCFVDMLECVVVKWAGSEKPNDVVAGGTMHSQHCGKKKKKCHSLIIKKKKVMRM